MRLPWEGARGAGLVGALAAVLILGACGAAKPAANSSSSPTAESSIGSPSPSPSPSSPQAAASASPATPSTPPKQGSPTTNPSTPKASSGTGTPGSGGGTGGGNGGGGTSTGCTLSVIEAVAGESSAEDDAKSPGWGPIRANGWTAFVPGGNWIITASDAGADIMSPDGKSDSSLEEWDAQTPWTVAGLQDKLLAEVSNVQTICTAGAETVGNTHATEFTGTFRGEAIHGVILVSLLTPTAANLYQAQTRSMYSPVSAWSADEATTLMVISKRAIQSPNSLPIPQG
ncbi:MAG TPA: hypothetical protein VFW71_06420 [Actinomycetota bacterium]|nr:hypothetical protein [Actinomycetota bacterium]